MPIVNTTHGTPASHVVCVKCLETPRVRQLVKEKGIRNGGGKGEAGKAKERKRVSRQKRAVGIQVKCLAKRASISFVFTYQCSDNQCPTNANTSEML